MYRYGYILITYLSFDRLVVSVKVGILQQNTTKHNLESKVKYEYNNHTRNYHLVVTYPQIGLSERETVTQTANIEFIANNLLSGMKVAA